MQEANNDLRLIGMALLTDRVNCNRLRQWNLRAIPGSTGEGRCVRRPGTWTPRPVF